MSLFIPPTSVITYLSKLGMRRERNEPRYLFYLFLKEILLEQGHHERTNPCLLKERKSFHCSLGPPTNVICCSSRNEGGIPNNCFFFFTLIVQEILFKMCITVLLKNIILNDSIQIGERLMQHKNKQNSYTNWCSTEENKPECQVMQPQMEKVSQRGRSQLKVLIVKFGINKQNIYFKLWVFGKKYSVGETITVFIVLSCASEFAVIMVLLSHNVHLQWLSFVLRVPYIYVQVPSSASRATSYFWLVSSRNTLFNFFSLFKKKFNCLFFISNIVVVFFYVIIAFIHVSSFCHLLSSFVKLSCPKIDNNLCR